MMRIKRIILVNPPRNKKPNVERSQRISNMTAIVRKIPGRKLIKRIIRIRKKRLWIVNGKPAKTKRGKYKKPLWINPKSQRRIKIPRIIFSITIFIVPIIWQNCKKYFHLGFKIAIIS